MANQLKMAEVQAILALARSGWSQRHIARQLGVDRETVGRHLRLSMQDGSKPASAPPGSTALAAGGSVSAASNTCRWKARVLRQSTARITGSPPSSLRSHNPNNFLT